MGIVIIGSGLAGYQLARSFRKHDKTTPLTIITASDGQFYPKPQLSVAKTNKKSAATLATATAEAMATQLNADIRTNTLVSSIDTEEQTVNCGDESIRYDRLVLACGAQTIKPPMVGTGVDAIHSVNHLEDYAYFEKMIDGKKNITILGAGLIGCEFANDLSNTGYEVNLIDRAFSPLPLLVPPAIGNLLKNALEKNGVQFYLDCVAKKIDKVDSDFKVYLSNNEILNTDFVMSAVGLRPNILLASRANIATNRGIIVNSYLETSVPHIYALGDCAEVEGHVLPYIAPILNAAQALGKTLAGERTAVEYPAMPVIIKTPAHPIAVCPPPFGMNGSWDVNIEDNNARALFYNDDKQLYGFVLTNAAVKERDQLSKQIPKLI